jgi:hypothetical protein
MKTLNVTNRKELADMKFSIIEQVCKPAGYTPDPRGSGYIPDFKIEKGKLAISPENGKFIRNWDKIVDIVTDDTIPKNVAYFLNKQTKPLIRFILDLKGDVYASVFNKHRK